MVLAARESSRPEAAGCSILAGVLAAEVAWGATYLLVAEQEPTIWLVPVLLGVATLTTPVVIRRRRPPARHAVTTTRLGAALSGVILLLCGCAQESTRGGRPTQTPTMGIRSLPLTGSLTIEGGPFEGQHEVGPGRDQHKVLPGGCSTTDLGHGRELQIVGHFSVDGSLVAFMFFAPYGSGEDLRARQFSIWGGSGDFKGDAILDIDIGPETRRGGREHLTMELDARARSMRISGELNCLDDGAYPDPTPSPSPRDGRSADEPLP